MRRAIIIFSVFVLLLTLAIVLFFNYKENDIIENTYCVKTNYAFLSEDDVQFNIKLYTNKKESLIKYAEEAITTIHNKSEEVVVNVDVVDVYNSSTTTYIDEAYYEYTVKIKINITKIEIDDCYLTMKFANKAYTFNIGSLEIKENLYEDNNLKILDLYGVSSVDDNRLSGIVITINNSNNYNLKITNITIGKHCQILLDSNNNTTIKESNMLEDYYQVELNDSNGYLLIEANAKKTFILPINHKNNNYISNCYLLINCNGNIYYLSNYNYINSNDLESLNSYLFEGIIYDI